MVWTGLPRLYWNRGRESRRHVQVHDLIVPLDVRRGVVIAQSEVQGQVPSKSPVILDVHIPGTPTEVVREVPILQRRRLRKSKQEICKIIAGSLNRIPVNEGGRSRARKRKGAA